MIHNWNFNRPHTCHGKDEFEQLLNDKSLQLEFPKQSLCHFWIRTRNECPVISDLAIRKLSAFCAKYLCEAAFSKLIIIKSKNRCFLKYVENVLLPALSCIDLRRDDLCKHQVHPSHWLCVMFVNFFSPYCFQYGVVLSLHSCLRG